MKELTKSGNVDFTTQLLLILLGFGISVLRVYPTQNEDMGIFLTVSSFVARGQTLYQEVFDIKDPLFFLQSALGIKVFGPIGPFIFESIYVALSVPLSYILLRELGYRRYVALISSLIFVLSLTGNFYQPFRTQIHAIVLLIASNIFLLRKKDFLAGFMFAIAFFFKLPIAVFALFPFGVFLYWKASKRAISWILGFTLLTTLVSLLMLLRGEFIGYLHMVKENIRYSQVYTEIIGLGVNSLFLHIDLWNDYNFGFLLSMVVLATLKIVFRGSLLKFEQKWFAISIAIAIVLYILLTLMWPHHLQLTSLFSLALIPPILNTIKIDRIKTDYKNKLFPKEMKQSLISTVSCLITLHVSGFNIPSPSVENLQKMLNVELYQPREALYINEMSIKGNRVLKIARLGSNDDSGYGAFIDRQKIEYACKRIGIYGHETMREIDKFLDCIENEVDVLTIAPTFENLKRFSGTYKIYQQRAKEIVFNRFDCLKQDSEGYSICLRKI